MVYRILCKFPGFHGFVYRNLCNGSAGSAPVHMQIAASPDRRAGIPLRKCFNEGVLDLFLENLGRNQNFNNYE
jgi:hypothetical protein